MLSFLKFTSIMFAGFMVGNLIIREPIIVSYNALVHPFGVNWVFTIVFNLFAGFLPLGIIAGIQDTLKNKKSVAENKLIEEIGQ